jgi:hypothetical protein
MDTGLRTVRWRCSLETIGQIQPKIGIPIGLVYFDGFELPQITFGP